MRPMSVRVGTVLLDLHEGLERVQHYVAIDLKSVVFDVYRSLEKSMDMRGRDAVAAAAKMGRSPVIRTESLACTLPAGHFAARGAAGLPLVFVFAMQAGMYRVRPPDPSHQN